MCAGWPHVSCGPSLREKLIDVSRRLSKSTLSLQARAGRGNSITLGIENRDLITVIALVVKYKLGSSAFVVYSKAKARGEARWK